MLDSVGLMKYLVATHWESRGTRSSRSSLNIDIFITSPEGKEHNLCIALVTRTVIKHVQYNHYCL